MYDINKVKFTENKVAKYTYIPMYNRLFDLVSPFEKLYNKDLCEFTQHELYVMFKDVSSKFKYNTVVTFNSLIKDYKTWCKDNEINTIDEVCTVKQLKENRYKQYVILGEDDILNITEYLAIDGAGYNAVMFIRLFWEVDGREKVDDIVSIRIDDINDEEKSVIINNNKYYISDWLVKFILEFAEADYLAFEDKRGRYPIKTARENNGYIFRNAYTSRTVVGEPIDAIKLSGVLYQFSKKYLTETITVDDLLMSLALRYMLTHKKSHVQMYSEKRYFQNMPSLVYARVFEEFAKDKYEFDYKEYRLYFNV